jgi:stage II sporulation protein Q
MKEEQKIQPLRGEQKTTPAAIEGTSIAGNGSRWQRITRKKWVFPATYMVAAVVILTLMWAYQNSLSSSTVDSGTELQTTSETVITEEALDSLAVTAETNSLAWPVANYEALEVIMEFFDANDSQEENQAAMVEYGDTYTPHLGMDLASPNNETFEVLAAQAGQVIRVEQVPIVGQLIEIDHGNGLSTVYQSLTEVQVKQGDEVTRGQLIAKAGRNELETELGVHLHFEVWSDNTPVNPIDYLE